jgi:hypothetical protein
MGMGIPGVYMGKSTDRFFCTHGHTHTHTRQARTHPGGFNLKVVPTQPTSTKVTTLLCTYEHIEKNKNKNIY